MMLENDFTEVDYAFESVFEAAMEATEKKLISTKDRNQLPDECFGIIYTNDKGKVVRAYPLKVPVHPFLKTVFSSHDEVELDAPVML